VRCPRCAHEQDRVIDSRAVRDGRGARRGILRARQKRSRSAAQIEAVVDRIEGWRQRSGSRKIDAADELIESAGGSAAAAPDGEPSPVTAS
jgi:transcriptional regulator NrdR family protein